MFEPASLHNKGSLFSLSQLCPLPCRPLVHLGIEGRPPPYVAVNSTLGAINVDAISNPLGPADNITAPPPPCQRTTQRGRPRDEECAHSDNFRTTRLECRLVSDSSIFNFRSFLALKFNNTKSYFFLFIIQRVSACVCINTHWALNQL